MMLTTLVLAEMLRLTVPQVLHHPPNAPPPSRYDLSDFASSIESEAERCICMTTRLSPATLRSEILLVSDCECGK